MSNPTNDETITQELLPSKVDDSQIYEQTNNDLIHLSFSASGLHYEITPQFKNVLATSRKLALDSEKLLHNATAETIDEDELSRIRDEMKPIKQYRRDVDTTMKDLRRVFDDTKKKFTGHVEGLLENAQFDVIEKNDERAKKLNKDVQALRMKRNWEAVEEAYNEALGIYPELVKTFPKRLAFSTFTNDNEKLASGAKNWKLNDAVVNTIKTYIQNVYTNNQIIERMESRFESELLKRYDSTGDIKAAMDLEDQFKKEEAEALKRQQKIIEQEAKRKAEAIERKRLMDERAKQQAEVEAKRKEEAAKRAAEEAKQKAAMPPKPIPESGIASAPFGMEVPKEQSVSMQIAKRVGFKKLAKRMEKDEWSISALESMDLIHRFLNGVYDQEKGITELISSPEQVMEIVREFMSHTR